jgi:amidase
MPLNTVKTPTLEQLGEVAAELGFNLSQADLSAHLEALQPSFAAYNLLDRFADEMPPVAYPRRP